MRWFHPQRVAIALIAFGSIAALPASARAAEVTVTVKASGSYVPLYRATVQLVDPSNHRRVYYSATTNSNGIAVLKNVAPRVYTIVAAAPGYQSNTKYCNVPKASSTPSGTVYLKKR